MRRLAALAAAAAFATVWIGTPGVAVARPLPSEATQKGLLLTSSQAKTASAYSGEIVTPFPAYCDVTQDGGRDCSLSFQPTTDDLLNNPQSYPFLVAISGFLTTAEAMDHWRQHVSSPQAYSGETIVIMTKTATQVTYVAIPANPAQMHWAYTTIRGRQGILTAGCIANATGPSHTLLAKCSADVAKAQARAVKESRPRTPLG